MRRPVGLSLATVAPSIPPGSIVLWRAGWRPSQRVIAADGRCTYSHVEMVASGLFPQLLGFVATGPVRHSLSAMVREYPGRLDLYEPVPAVAEAHGDSWDGIGAVDEMAAQIARGKGYGWWHLARLAVRRVPMLRLVMPRSTDKANGRRPRTMFCSHAVARACRIGGGFDAVPRLADWETQPADLARSLFFRFAGRLEP